MGKYRNCHRKCTSQGWAVSGLSAKGRVDILDFLFLRPGLSSASEVSHSKDLCGMNSVSLAGQGTGHRGGMEASLAKYRRDFGSNRPQHSVPDKNNMEKIKMKCS